MKSISIEMEIESKKMKKELNDIKSLTIDKNCIESFRCWLIKTDIKDENGARPSWNSLLYDIQYSLEAWLKRIK